MTKTKTKHWHLNDFEKAGKFMYIVLNKDFHKKFFNAAVNLAGSQLKLAEILGFYSSRINNYISQKRRPSLISIKKISNYLVSKGKEEYNMFELEKNVKKIKVNGQPISISPKFPINLDKNLVRIVANILGDGGINKCYDPHYSNSDEVLINNFKDQMLFVFGCNASRNYIIQKRVQIWYPRIVGKMLIDMFGNFSLGKKPKYIPKEILNLQDKKLLSSFLNSFYGDEGTSSKYQIGLIQGKKNFDLLVESRIMLKKLNINSNKIIKIRERHIMTDPYTKKEYIGNEIFAFFITGYNEIKKFKEVVGFPRNSEKNKKFLKMFSDLYINGIKRNRVGVTREKILELLNQKPMKVTEIPKELDFSKVLILYHVKKLINSNKVYIKNNFVKIKRW